MLGAQCLTEDGQGGTDERGLAVRGYASMSPGKRLNVFLVNQSSRQAPFELRIRAAVLPESRAQRRLYRGSSPGDQQPSWGPEPDLDFTPGGPVTSSLDPFSITVLSFPGARR